MTFSNRTVLIMQVWLVAGDCFLIGLAPVLVHMSKGPDGKFPFHPVSINLLVEVAKTLFATIILIIYVSLDTLSDQLCQVSLPNSDLLYLCPSYIVQDAWPLLTKEELAICILGKLWYAKGDAEVIVVYRCTYQAAAAGKRPAVDLHVLG